MRNQKKISFEIPMRMLRKHKKISFEIPIRIERSSATDLKNVMKTNLFNFKRSAKLNVCCFSFNLKISISEDDRSRQR